MFNWTDMDLRRADYTARTERVNQEGWMHEASRPTSDGRTRRMPGAVELMRQQIGDALIRTGERLQGKLAADPASPAAARYTPDAIR